MNSGLLFANTTNFLSPCPQPPFPFLLCISLSCCHLLWCVLRTYFMFRSHHQLYCIFKSLALSLKRLLLTLQKAYLLSTTIFMFCVALNGPSLCIWEYSFILAFPLIAIKLTPWNKHFSPCFKCYVYLFISSPHSDEFSSRNQWVRMLCRTWSAFVGGQWTPLTCGLTIGAKLCGRKTVPLRVPLSRILERKEIYIKIICGNNYSVLLASSECLLAKIWKPTINQVALGKITTSLRIPILASKSRCFATKKQAFFNSNMQNLVSKKHQV